MQLDTEIQRIEADTEAPGAEKISPRPYRLHAYDQLWERLVTRLDGGSLDESTQTVVEVGLLLAAGLHRIERAIGMTAYPELLADVLGQTPETG